MTQTAELGDEEKEQEKILEYARIMSGLVSEEGDQVFLEKSKTTINCIGGQKLVGHPVAGPLFMATFVSEMKK